MFTRKHYINLISLFLSSIISLLFVIKFSLFSGKNVYIISAAFLILFFFIVISLDKTEFKRFPFINDKFLASLFLLLIVILLFIVFTNPAIQKSEKLIVIRIWLSQLFDGTLFYDKEYFLLPVYYFIALPFYELGTIALINVAALSIFSLFIYENSGSIKEKIIKAFLVLLTPLTFYSVMEAGAVFLAVSLLIFSIYYLENIKENKINVSFILGSLFLGLLLSTIPEMLIPVLLTCIYLFKRSLKKGILFFLLIFFFFILTLAPFYFYDKYSITIFLINNLNFFNNLFNIYTFLAFLLIVIYAGWLVTDLQELFYVIALSLFFPFIISFLIISYNSGFSKTITLSFDFSYFFLSLPFIIASIKDYRVDHFLGKIFEIGEK